MARPHTRNALTWTAGALGVAAGADARITAIFAIVLVAHGLIHVLGFLKAFGLADLPQLTQAISPLLGVLWLLAAFLFLAAAAALFVWPRGWWRIGACAIVISMFLIVLSWNDARFGALGNLAALIGVARHRTLRAAGFRRDGA